MAAIGMRCGADHVWRGTGGRRRALQVGRLGNDGHCLPEGGRGGGQLGYKGRIWIWIWWLKARRPPGEEHDGVPDNTISAGHRGQGSGAGRPALGDALLVRAAQPPHGMARSSGLQSGLGLCVWAADTDSGESTGHEVNGACPRPETHDASSAL